MRATTILLVIAVAACTGGAVYGQSQQAAEAAPGNGQREFRGELYPHPETGCIELPEDPHITPRLWPYRAPGDEAEALPPAEGTDPPGSRRAADAVGELSDHDLGLDRKPWPLCEDPEVSVVVTEEGASVLDAPSAPGR